MNRPDLEILSALVDGESVDPEALLATLETPEGRAALVDFARVRRDVRAEEAPPRPAFYEAMTRAGLHSTGERRRALPVWRPALAASLALGIGLGAVAGFLARPRGPAEEVPPVASRTIVFEPGVNWTAQANGEGVER
jgi:Negative regulator of sigma E activity